MAEQPAIDFIEAMSVLHVEPGDTVVLKTHISVTFEQRALIEEAVSKKLGCPVLLLDSGLDIGVLRQAA